LSEVETRSAGKYLRASPLPRPRQSSFFLGTLSKAQPGKEVLTGNQLKQQ